MTFEEWWGTHTNGTGNYSREDAKAAWDAAMKQAAKTAREQTVRYTCRHKKAICRAIADTIEGQQK